MFRLNQHSVVTVLLIAGLLIVIFAYATLNLFQMSMANIAFLREHGWEAVMEGALWQLGEIVASAIIAMLTYIGFKICESDLVRRYQKWQDR